MLGYVNCPYCGIMQEIDYSSGYGCDEGVEHRKKCTKCRKNFIFETYNITVHEAREI